MQQDIDYDGEIAKRYEDGRALHAEAIRTFESAVAPHTPTKGVVIDIGAGTGRFARPLASVARTPVIAVEPASGMRNSRPESTADIAWVAGSAEALPLATGSVGLAWSAFTTHYLNLEQAASEIARVLHSQGCALIWHSFPDRFDELDLFKWFPTARVIDDKRMPSVETVVASFEGSGLTFVERTEHQMRIAHDLSDLADRLAYRSISTMHLISDDEFNTGLERLRAEAASQTSPDPVYATNSMLRFVK